MDPLAPPPPPPPPPTAFVVHTAAHAAPAALASVLSTAQASLKPTTTVVRSLSSFFVVDHTPDLQIGRVRPGLLVSSQDAASDPAVLCAAGVTHVLDVGGCNLPPLAPGDTRVVRRLAFALHDVPEQALVDTLPPCHAFIDEALATGGCILVHCNAGISRSVSVVIAYLMLRESLTYDEALAQVKAVRREARPNAGFASQLRTLQEPSDAPTSGALLCCQLRALQEPSDAPTSGALVPWKFANPHVSPHTLPERRIPIMGTSLLLKQEPCDDICREANTGLVLWDAAYVLADLMERNVAIAEASWRNSRVLELGAGLGLPTLVAWLQGARVVATDGAERELALLRHNIAHAIPAEAVPPGVPPPAVLPLWWGDEAQSVAVQAQLSTPAHSSMEERSSPNGSTALQCRESPLFDIILCCECVYNAEAHEPLLAAWRRLGSTQATVLLVYKRRGLDEDAFATLLAAQADWRCRRLSPRLFHPDFAAASDIVVTVVRRVVEQ